MVIDLSPLSWSFPIPLFSRAMTIVTRSQDGEAPPPYFKTSLNTLQFPNLDDTQKKFFMDQTGIIDEEELIRHAMDIRARAFAVCRAFAR
jgi:hypothetical protein